MATAAAAAQSTAPAAPGSADCGLHGSVRAHPEPPLPSSSSSHCQHEDQPGPSDKGIQQCTTTSPANGQVVARPSTSAASSSSPTAPPRPTRPRTATTTTTAEIDSTISHPGSVRINVKGAFIVEGGSATPATPAADGTGYFTNPNNARSGSPDHHQTQGIRLPNHTAVVSHIAIDIGGSLAKLVYFSREAHSTEPGGRLNFTSFETDRIDDCVAFMRHLRDEQQPLNGSKPDKLCVMATGGGAYKYYDKIREALGVDVLREDEMECLIIGLDFFITEIPREVFTYSETEPMHFAPPAADLPEGEQAGIYPYLLVNIGSGVSFLKVEGPRKYQRVGGTSLGGGTLWGLLSLLTGARTFDEMLDLASSGDNSRVDMLVGDIYGTDYGKIGLKSSTIASSFGKVFRMKREAESAAEDSGGGSSEQPAQHGPGGTAAYSSGERRLNGGDAEAKDGSTSASASPNSDGFSAADMSRSLLYAVSNNIGQIAYLQSQIHNLSAIYFGGSFIRGHPQTMNTLSYAIRFWSKGASQAYFLRHEGYLGAVGAFLKRQPRNWGRRGSFEESRPTDVERRMRRRGEPSPPPPPPGNEAPSAVSDPAGSDDVAVT